jgi:hypothetical protein
MNTAETAEAACHERSDGSPGLVLLTACWLLVGIGLVLLASLLVYGARYRGLPATREMGPESSFRHGPEERSSIARDWVTQDRLVREHLTTYGWVDREAGVVRIPIERAMEMVAAESQEERK